MGVNRTLVLVAAAAVHRAVARSAHISNCADRVMCVSLCVFCVDKSCVVCCVCCV